MKRSCKLKIESSVIFGEHVLTIGLLSHLNVGNWIPAFFQIGDLRNGVFGSGIDQGNRNHGRQSARVTAGVEEVESYLLAGGWTKIRGSVPRVDRGTNGSRLILFRRMPNQVIEFTVRRRRSKKELADGIAHPVSFVRRSV